MKQYISYVRHRFKPTLTREAADLIAAVYQALRQDEDSKTQHITARCLETLIGLATAHAKLRLDKLHLVREDAQAAAEVLRFELFNQAEPDKSEKAFRRRNQRGRGRSAGDGGYDGDSDSDGDGGDAAVEADEDENETAASNAMDVENTAETGASGAASRRRGVRRRRGEGEGGDAGRGDGGEEQTERNAIEARTRAVRESEAAMGGSGVAEQLPELAEAAGGSQMEVEEGVEGAVGSSEAVGAHVQRVKDALNRLRGREGTMKIEDGVQVVSTSGEGADGMGRADVEKALDALTISERKMRSLIVVKRCQPRFQSRRQKRITRNK